jgi:hypothetical protein
VDDVDVVVNAVCAPFPVKVFCESANEEDCPPASMVIQSVPAALGKESVWSAVLTSKTPEGMPVSDGFPEVFFRNC